MSDMGLALVAATTKLLIQLLVSSALLHWVKMHVHVHVHVHVQVQVQQKVEG